MNGKKEYGDYQTPIKFTEQICSFLKNERHILPTTVLEPTCGIGNFLKSSFVFGAKQYYGIEINREYCNICKEYISSENVAIINADFFKVDLKQLEKTNLLVLGNPPWVTNSTLSTLDSSNLPQKENFKGMKGMDALTGASNFDICEYMIIRLLKEYHDTNTTIAMLCKTSVARNVFKELKRQRIPFSNCEIVEFDASKVFGIRASACLLLIQLTDSEISSESCQICSLEDQNQAKTSFGYQNGGFFSDLSKITDNLDGKCCFEWRQGVKHDCSQVMELELKNGIFQNGQKESVMIENALVFPLIKSSHFKKPILHNFSKYVIVTQQKIREDTAHIKSEYPLTWEYLQKNKALFEKRKSSIYRGAPDFSMFGVGAYSYAPYKVGISGFYKDPLFAVLYSKDQKPVMTDDTGYFICFPSYNTAYVVMLYLNSLKVQNFLKSIAFMDAKRPYTKKILERIDFQKVYRFVSFQELVETEQRLGLESYLTSEMLREFLLLPEMSQQSLL